MTLGLDGSVEMAEKRESVTASHESLSELKRSPNGRDDGQCNNGHPAPDNSVENEETAVASDGLPNEGEERQTSNKIVEKDTPVSQHPVDGGYAWVVLIAVFFIQFLLIGYTKSLGVIFVEFQSKFGSNASMTSLIVSVTEAVASLGGFLVMGFLMKVLSPRSIALIGCGFFTAGVAGNSLFKQLEYLCLTQGVMYGMATCMIYGPSLYVVTQYFVKRRPLAAAIASCGTSFGGMVFPLLIRRLVDEYSFEGGILLTAGVIMHAFVFSSLLTPIQNYDRRGRKGKSKKPSFSDKIKNRFRGREPESDHTTSEELFPLNKPEILDVSEVTPPLEWSNGKLRLRSEDTETTTEGVSGGQLKRSLSGGDKHFEEAHECQNQSSGTEDVTNAERTLEYNNGNKELVETKMNHDATELITSSAPLIRKTRSSPRLSDTMHSPESTSTPPVRPNTPVALADSEGRPTIDIEGYPDAVYKARRKMSQISSATSIFVSTSNIHVSYADILNLEDRESTARRTPSSDAQPNLLRRALVRCGHSTLVRSASFWALTVFYFCAMVGNAIPQTYIPALAKERGLSDADGAFFLSLLNVLDFPARMSCGIIVNFRLIRPTTACIPPMLVVALVGYMTSFFTSYESFLGMAITYGLCLGIYFAMQSLIVIDVLGIDNFRTAIGFYYLFMGLGGAVSYPIAGTLKDLTGTYSSTYHYLATMNLVAVFQLLVVVPLAKRYDVRRGVLQETDPNK
ncbi:unnamed protein product [Lymnaea stagnalis]|uniref:Major facilitator superfamily (MFS) profile domain-containing protein n=1 Tax=Lymnaea stagnalis TaxID=6523 RepID=A0AAV2HU94_LYMST